MIHFSDQWIYPYDDIYLLSYKLIFKYMFESLKNTKCAGCFEKFTRYSLKKLF